MIRNPKFTIQQEADIEQATYQGGLDLAEKLGVTMGICVVNYNVAFVSGDHYKMQGLWSYDDKNDYWVTTQSVVEFDIIEGEVQNLTVFSTLVD